MPAKNNTLDELLKNILRDVEKLKEAKTTANVETFDVIYIPEQMEVIVIDTLTPPVEGTIGAVVGVDIVGFCQVGEDE